MKLAKNIWKHFTHDDLSMVAAALAFTTVLSLIPFFAVTLSALNYFNSLEALTPKVEAFLLANLKGTAGTEGIALVKKVISRIQNGRIGTVGALILIITATRMLVELENAVHRIWMIKNTRPLAKRLFFDWLILLVFPFLIALWVGVFSTKTVKSSLAQFLPFESGFVIGFFVLYGILKWTPSVKVSALPAGIGALFSTTLLWLLEQSFKWLSTQVFSYGKMYGSIAAIPASLLWVLMIWWAILLGVALTASIQKSQGATN